MGIQVSAGRWYSAIDAADRARRRKNMSPSVFALSAVEIVGTVGPSSNMRGTVPALRDDGDRFLSGLSTREWPV
jgi:hypothetical protein